MQDLIIRNGRVIDWATHTDKTADVAVKDGKITEIGEVKDAAAKEIDASGLLVIPGVIDSHMHASDWLGGPMSYRMLALAGVTTALEMAGPLESVKRFMRENGSGINVGCLEQLRPGLNISSENPTDDELERVMRDALARGAFGVKLLGGHYPLTPDATARLIQLTSEAGVYFAVHAGSTEKGSNIEGMREVIELAHGTPFHLCHINAYCRGSIRPVEDEVREATQLLLDHPEIDTESYLSPINGCSGKCGPDGVPESGVTRNCLKSAGLSVDRAGMRAALASGYAQAHVVKDGAVMLAGNEESVAVWEARGSDVPVSFHVNPGLSRFWFATEKRPGGAFLCDSFCTDGGGIPRNVIIANGLSLVKFGAMTLQEFVLKSSYAASRLLGLANKGTLAPGADADITVVDFEAQKAVHAFCAGRATLENGVACGTGGTLVTAPGGAAAAKAAGLGAIEADIPALFKHRLERFE